MKRICFGCLRVAALVAAALAVLLYVDYRAARAAVFERLLGLGQRMASYLDDASTTEAPRMLELNGVHFLVAAGRTNHPPEMVRGFYRDRYAGKETDLIDLLKQLKAHHAVPPTLPGLPALEFGNAEQGGVAALDLGPGKISIRDLIERFDRFRKTGNLGDIGRLRYCYTERSGNGGTRFLTIWTEEKFNLNQLIAANDRSDAPGRDLDGVPRYPGTRRILSGAEAGMPQGLAVYEGAGSAETAMMFYRARMKTLGWGEEPNFTGAAAEKGKQALHFARQGHEVFLAFSDHETGPGVSIVAMRLR